MEQSLNHCLEVRLSTIIIFNLTLFTRELNTFIELVTMESNTQQLKIEEGQKQLKYLQEASIVYDYRFITIDPLLHL